LCTTGDLVERGQSLADLGGREDADWFESLGPSAIDGEFIKQQSPIERERPLERVEARVWFAVEASSHSRSSLRSVMGLGLSDRGCQSGHGMPCRN